MDIRIGAAAHVGSVRANNEDFYFASPTLMAIADGVGGRPAGEVASRMAVSIVAEIAGRIGDQDGSIDAAFQVAHQAVRGAGASNSLLTGMCSTLTVAVPRAERLEIFHVGDSRFYLVREAGLSQITVDQNVINKGLADGTMTTEEAAQHPNPGLLFQAVGSLRIETLEIWHYEVPLDGQDRFLLATDGLQYATDDAVAAALVGNRDPQAAADALVQATLDAGAGDNVTVIVGNLSA